MRTLVLLLLFLQNPSIPKEELLGQFDQSAHPDFVLIDQAYTSKSGLYLRKEVYASFQRMADQASKDGIRLTIVSATRNFNYQKGIWERKWDRPKYMGWQELNKTKDIMRYSSMPGTSRHHWGTDVDLNQLENSWFEDGEGKKVYDWLTEHAEEYGFHQVYTSQTNGRTGYLEEKWHWSYLPLAQKLTEQAELRLKNEMIEGFKGAETAVSIGVVDQFILGINSACL